jgi:DNA polymerase III epsilon subunit family exonuclease
MKIIPFQDFVRRYHSGEEFVIFDTETTGLNTYHDDIIEIAGVIWKKGSDVKTFEELIWVNPNKIEGEAQAIHKITAKDVENARQPKFVFSDFIEFCDNRTLVAHNAKFDFDILNSNLIKSGLVPYQNEEVFCSLVYAREQLLPARLTELAQYYQIYFQDKSMHRAMYDVKVLMGILDKVMKANEPEDLQYSLIL